jgi:molecular chaperone HtpG
VPIWQRPRGEVTDEQMSDFYKEQFGEDAEPVAVIRVAAEGAAVSYKAMLFIPSEAPYDYFTREYEPGLRLYASGVLIMEKCAALLPEYFRFVRGVVDSADLSLNISRETLQHDRQLKTIAANLEKKVKAELVRLLESEPDRYATFYRAFGIQLKYGILGDYGLHKDNLKELLMFYSPRAGRAVTLAQYVAEMAEEQKYIYYACGGSAAALDALPQAEPLRARGYDVLYMTDDVDEFVVRALGSFEEKELRSVTSDDLGLLTEEEKRDTEVSEEANRPLLDFVTEALGGRVAAAKLSSKLVSAPVCLATQGGVTLEMEKYFSAMRTAEGAEPVRAERVLELNASHGEFEALKAAFEGDKERAAKLAELLYGQAVIMAGLTVEDPVRFCEIMGEFIAG